MSDSRPISRASAPQETSSKLTGKKAECAGSPEPQGPRASNKADPASTANLPAPTSHHPALTGLARLLGRQLARASYGEEGRDD